MITEKSTVKTEAIFSDCREYRYILKKEWDSKKPKASIIMKNPNISDMIQIDHTTMFIINNLVRLDYGGFDILNLIPKVATKINVSEIENIPTEILDENIKYFKKSFEGAEKILVAWGSLEGKAVTSIKNEVFEAMKSFEDKLFYISNEYGGKAFHPLAPQIRNIWLFCKYELNDKTEETTNKSSAANTDSELPTQESDTA